jgi:P2-related tail formation protein
MQHLERFSNRWLLGRKLVDLDVWPPNGEKHDDATLRRLDWAINWHTWSHLQARRWYTGIKGGQIIASAAIPVLTATGGTSVATRGVVAGLGALVVVLESFQQLKKYAQNALLWAQGKEALKQEYFLFQANVKPYDGKNSHKVLAERIERIIGKEVGKWAEEEKDAGDEADQDPRGARRMRWLGRPH